MDKIDEERCDIVDERKQDHFIQVHNILEEAKKVFLNAWVQIAIKYLLQSEKLQEVVYHGENISLFYYQQSSEKCVKMMFFSGLQVEMTSFLQDICITTEELVNLSRVRDVLHKYPPGSVFESSFTKHDPLLDNVNRESLTLNDVLLAKKTTEKFEAKAKREAKHPKRSSTTKTLVAFYL
uniref:HORMA domain-containing protein n=1 Tax=Ascaris lumbricoides TaxID=6252 RepID=A0A0M3I5U0_ASCLU